MADTEAYKYEVAISCAEADSPYADELARALKRRGVSFFYDKHEEFSTWGQNLYDYLSNLFQNKARYCVMFLSRHYADERWANLQRQAAQARAFRERVPYILPVCLDDTEIPGIFPTTGRLKWPPQDAESVADAVVAMLRGRTSPAHQTPEADEGKGEPRPHKQISEAYLVEYIIQAEQAHRDNAHRSKRRQILLDFLLNAFHIEANQVDTRTEGVARIDKSWVVAAFTDIVFLFKQDMGEKEAGGPRELRDYLSGISGGIECVGLLTDGLRFTAYVFDADGSQLQEIDSVDLEELPPGAASSWLDSYLMARRGVPPTAADIVQRFGLPSPTFASSARMLRGALADFGTIEGGALEVKWQQWASHLARIYGSADIGDDEVFMRHTYLCQLAKILAYAAQFSAEDAVSQIEGVIRGTAFEVLGVSNIGEEDFFAWVLSQETAPEALSIFRRVAASLAVYNLRDTPLEGLLKLLYQNLVEPETRHGLGIFYTPAWLAELMLKEIDFGPGQSLLDPACGSGTFLCAAIRLLVERGMTGRALVDFALGQLVGMDVHPLAVTIARVNYMLAILPHMEGGADRHRVIPISMSDTLQSSTKVEAIEAIEVPAGGERAFRIPVEAAAHHPSELVEVLEEMGRAARHANFTGFTDFALSRTSSTADQRKRESERAAWDGNVRLLATLLEEGRDSIWIYILQNMSRPQFLKAQKFDVVAGNPPWIAYRYIQDPADQIEIKKLVREYRLLAPDQMKLHTQMEVATLFFEHCREVYLKPGGTIAFVMPRSVITAAKQHYAFQRVGFSHILDLKGVKPLFKVETCVMIREGDRTLTAAIPTTRYVGKLPAHDSSLAEAAPALAEVGTKTDLIARENIASPYYYAHVPDGANLYPRTLVFVKSEQKNLAPGQLARTKMRITDPDVRDDAKEPWKPITLKGYIHDHFLYATLLSKNLLPFGVKKCHGQPGFHLVALPVRVGVPSRRDPVPTGSSGEKRFIPMSVEEMRDTVEYARSADDWFDRVERRLSGNRQAKGGQALMQRLNFFKKLTSQSPEPGYLVVYGATGSDLTAAVIDTHTLPVVHGVHPQAFVVDHKTYWYRCASLDEAHYLAAMLNAPYVNSAIKAYQTRGLFGERDIHRRPFEICAIPRFSESDPDHMRLASLLREAAIIVAGLNLAEREVVSARRLAREGAHMFIAVMDDIVRELLELALYQRSLEQFVKPVLH